MGVGSLAEIFNLPRDRITRDLITAQAINWGNDPFARGAYSYATPETRQAQTALRKINEGAVFFSGEALYAGRDMGTVEAALVNGKQIAQAIFWPPDHKRVQPGPREDCWQNSVVRKSPHI